MKQYTAMIVMGLLGLTLVGAATSHAAKELTDSEMDTVHAGNSETVETDAGLLDPAADSASSLTVDNSMSSISLSGSAQQNLSSMVNVLAINSNVQVLMNVNVAIDSEIGLVNQGNNGSQIK